MKELKYTTFEEQVNKVRSQGLLIDDDFLTKKQIQTYGFYNIINGYRDPYINIDSSGNKSYTAGTSFQKIFSLFLLDHNLRSSIMAAMIDLEDHLRTVAAEVVAKNFGIHQEFYLKFSNYRDRSVKDPRFSLKSILKKLNDEVNRSQRGPIKHYRDAYGAVPPWVLFKGIYLSTLVNFIRLFKPKEKTDLVCQVYGIGEDTASLNSISNLLNDTLFICLEYRNLAAHGGRVYNYVPRAKTRLSNKSALELENLIENFNDRKNNYGLGSLLFLLSLFDYKLPFETIKLTLSQEIARHCSVFPEDCDPLSKITGVAVTPEYAVWVSLLSKKYHQNPFCSGLKNQVLMTLKDAIQQGFTPCKRCFK